MQNNVFYKYPEFDKSILLSTDMNSPKSMLDQYSDLAHKNMSEIQEYINNNFKAGNRMNIYDFFLESKDSKYGIPMYWIHIYNHPDHGFLYDTFKMSIDSIFYSKNKYVNKYKKTTDGRFIYNSTFLIDVFHLNNEKKWFLISPQDALANKNKSKTSFKTYLMKDYSTGYVKIGKSKNPKVREKTLQSEKPTIEIIHIIDKNVEKDLHDKYCIQRSRGEWFNLSEQDIEFIKNNY